MRLTATVIRISRALLQDIQNYTSLIFGGHSVQQTEHVVRQQCF